MTFPDQRTTTTRRGRAHLLDTGVRRLAGAAGPPVVLLPDLRTDIRSALAPLLARRHDVYTIDDVPAGPAAAAAPGSPATARTGAASSALADAISADLPASPVIVGGALSRAIASRVPVAAVVVVGNEDPEMIRALPAPTISTDDTAHPAETAHIIDAFLRDIRQPHSAGSDAVTRTVIEPATSAPPAPGADDDRVDVDTIIVGSGFAGLGLAIRMQREGRHSYRVLERAGDVGGTWRDNVYPGVACDIPSHLYSFSFRPNPNWSRRYAPGREILHYLRDAARDEGVLPRIRFNSDVTAMRWDDETERWTVTTGSGSGTFRSRAVVIATGRLSEKRLPDIDGLDRFAGLRFHSSEWPDNVQLAGHRVGLVGTGASAVQMLPTIAKSAAEVVVFQRSAPYVVPRQDVEYSAATIRELTEVPEAVGRLRHHMFWDAEAGFAARIHATGSIDQLRARAAAHLRHQVPDPGLRDALSPDYEIGCKRVLLSDDYYPTFSEPNVTLENSAVTRVDTTRVTAASGREHTLDVLILATGFASTEPPIARVVTGRNGVRLSDAWSSGMVAHRSTTVAGFPNLFVIDGPNASLGHNSAIHMIETQIGFVLEALTYLRSAATLEPTRQAQDAYVAEVDRRAAGTVWTTGGCSSWYVDARTGRLALLWPDTASAFREEAGHFDPEEFLIRAARPQRNARETGASARIQATVVAPPSPAGAAPARTPPIAARVADPTRARMAARSDTVSTSQRRPDPAGAGSST